MYIKALEQEVLRLKETFTHSTRERDQIAQENQRLKALLSAHGIAYDFTRTEITFQRENSGNQPSSSGSISGSYGPGSDSTNGRSPISRNGTAPNQMQNGTLSQQTPQMRSMAQLPNNNLDYDSIGINFVLAYDSQGRPVQVPTPPQAPYPLPSPQR